MKVPLKAFISFVYSHYFNNFSILSCWVLSWLHYSLSLTRRRTNELTVHMTSRRGGSCFCLRLKNVLKNANRMAIKVHLLFVTALCLTAPTSAQHSEFKQGAEQELCSLKSADFYFLCLMNQSDSVLMLIFFTKISLFLAKKATLFIQVNCAHIIFKVMCSNLLSSLGIYFFKVRIMQNVRPLKERTQSSNANDIFYY